MSEFLFQYHAVEPTTWVYLSSLLMIGLFFKFSRLWSIRNLDLILLILLAPGLLMIHYGQIEQSNIRAELQTLIDSQKTENPAIENLDSATSPTSDRPGEITSPTSAVNLPKELDSATAEIL